MKTASQFQRDINSNFLPVWTHRRFACVRPDFRKHKDLKLQWDSVKDSSAYDFTSNAKMLTVTCVVLTYRSCAPLRESIRYI